MVSEIVQIKKKMKLQFLQQNKLQKEYKIKPFTFIGIRIKPFTEELKHRGQRTLDLFLTTLLTETNGKLPNNFVVMLPKVTIPEQIIALVSFFEAIEDNFQYRIWNS